MGKEKYRLDIHDRATLQERVTSKLRAVILSGEFAPGDRLVQEEWAQILGVSRMPVREALRQLEAEGLVRLEPRKGAIVTPITTDDVREIYQLRAITEGIAVEKAMPYFSDEDVEDLEQLLGIMEACADVDDDERFCEYNGQFHSVLRQGCPWRRVQWIIESLWKGFPPHTPNYLPNHMKQSNKEHRRILEAVKKRDGEAAKRAMEDHILRTGDSLVAYLEQNQKN